MHFSRSKASAKSPLIERYLPYSPMSASASKTLLSLGAGSVLVLLCSLLPAQQPDRSRLLQPQEDADRKSTGCVACHGKTDAPSMHTTGTVRLGCTDCHGGNPDKQPPAGTKPG